MKRHMLIAVMVVAATTAAAVVCGMATPGPGPATQGTEGDLKAKHAALLAPETAATLVMLNDLAQMDVQLHPPMEQQGMGFSSMMSMYDMPGYQAAFTKYGGELAQALAAKQEPVRGACVVTILTMPGKLAPGDQEKVRPWVPGVMGQLSKEEVTMVLNSRWVMARSPELLPVLLKMYDGLPDERVSAGKYGASEERNALLLRAYELSPEQVRPRVLAAIKNPGQRFSELWLTSLLGLPDKELPEMDETFVAMISGPPRDAGSVQIWLWARLVGRYGTAKIEADVKKAFEPAEGRWACTLQESMLAYFLRVDPEYGKRAFAKCLASRQTGCWRMLFGNVAALIWTPELEQLAIAALDDRDTEVPVSAAQVLRVKGSPASKEALLAALAKAYQANAPTTTPAYKEPEAARRRAIVTALLDGHGWVLTAAEAEKVQALAVEPDLANLCKAWAAQKAVTVSLAMEGSGKPAVRLGTESYNSLAELERKVSLFPAGMKFKVSGDEQDVVRREFMAWAKEHQLAVE